MARQGKQQQVTQSALLTSGVVQRMNPQKQGNLEHEPENSALYESGFEANLATVPVQRKAGTGEGTAKETKHPNNTGLPDNLKAGLEHLSGLDMSDVRVHYNSTKPAQLNALAYTQGTEIHIGPGQEKHLPHEGWHVVQQMQGSVKPTTRMKSGVNINDDKKLEKEADMMGAKAQQRRYISSQTNNVSLQPNYNPIQRVSVVQRISLDNKPLHYNSPYNNSNQANILAHMAGEWDRNNNGAVVGGHLLNSMVTMWGNAVPNSVPQAQNAQHANLEDGVHFPGPIPSLDRIIGDQFTFKIVTTHNGQKRVSNSKQSTFWPTPWNTVDLISTLNNSWQLGDSADKYASKANTNNTYWYQWQTLGVNTVFPNKRIKSVTGTERQKMRLGRKAALAYASRSLAE